MASRFYLTLYPYSALLVTSFCVLHLLLWFCVSKRSGTGGGGWCHTVGALHMAAVRLGFKGALGGTRWVNSHIGCMNRIRKCYSH